MHPVHRQGPWQWFLFCFLGSLLLLFSFFDFDLWIGSSFVCAKNSNNNKISSSMPQVCSCSKIGAGGCNQPFIVNDITHRISWVLSLFSLCFARVFSVRFSILLWSLSLSLSAVFGKRCASAPGQAATVKRKTRVRQCKQVGKPDKKRELKRRV